jgi:hypothetical protein
MSQSWYLKIPYRLLNMMIYMLYGEETSTHFIMEWFPMAYMVVKKGAKISTGKASYLLSLQIMFRPQRYEKPGFYMSSYLIDSIFQLIHSLHLVGIGP